MLPKTLLELLLLLLLVVFSLFDSLDKEYNKQAINRVNDI